MSYRIEGDGDPRWLATGKEGCDCEGSAHFMVDFVSGKAACGQAMEGSLREGGVGPRCGNCERTKVARDAEPLQVAEDVGTKGHYHLHRFDQEDALCGVPELKFGCGKPLEVWGRQPPLVPRKNTSFCFRCSQEAELPQNVRSSRRSWL